MLRMMAEERIVDAKAPLDGRRWAFAYYVAGYAVECALKSCLLARMIHTGGVFKDRKYAERCWTHDFGELINLAGLKDELNVLLKSSASSGGVFLANWGIVTRWKETSRYEAKTEQEAREIYDSIVGNPEGVMKWLQMHW
jgi:HEPN domain-containing protein